MPILTSIISWLNIKRISQIELMKKYPSDVQRETFYELIEKAKNTEWGLKYDYATIDSISDFQNRVPIQEYDDVKPYVNRLRDGESNLLWPSEIKWFAKSSGTTSDKSKFIPVSREALEDCHFQAGKDGIALYAQRYPDTDVFLGKTLVLGGSHNINNFSNQSYYGDLSAVLIQNLPFWAEFIRTPSLQTVLLDKWDEKIDKMTEEAIKVNVTSIAGVPSWMLVLLKNILKVTGKSTLKEVWPNLELFTHGGVAFTPYREEFERLIGYDKMRYIETYNASEGFFAIQDSEDEDSLLLMLDYGIFYEFIDMREIDNSNPKVYTIDDVELNTNYAMLISTNSGLWRYKIGDTVKFTSIVPHKIKITGRIKHFINAFGEELIIDNAEKAIHKACADTGAIIKEYTACPIYMQGESKGAHEWLFEFTRHPNNIDQFMQILDNKLKDVNSDYEAKRFKDMSLAFPKYTVLSDGIFYEWLKLKDKLGGQHKIPRLANHRDYVDELLSLQNQSN
ncbi:MAG: GH3 auxin-responsive promoter family protein [Bacteroidales bacterium]|nr:GH3 auxin-responsive promoter family protein [Bacteroidales bacterium]